MRIRTRTTRFVWMSDCEGRRVSAWMSCIARVQTGGWSGLCKWPWDGAVAGAFGFLTYRYTYQQMLCRYVLFTKPELALYEQFRNNTTTHPRKRNSPAQSVATKRQVDTRVQYTYIDMRMPDTGASHIARGAWSTAHLQCDLIRISV
jgi:hypothetical protein